jgi:hypothetical protein
VFTHGNKQQPLSGKMNDPMRMDKDPFIGLNSSLFSIKKAQKEKKNENDDGDDEGSIFGGYGFMDVIGGRPYIDRIKRCEGLDEQEAQYTALYYWGDIDYETYTKALNDHRHKNKNGSSSSSSSSSSSFLSKPNDNSKKRDDFDQMMNDLFNKHYGPNAVPGVVPPHEPWKKNSERHFPTPQKDKGGGCGSTMEYDNDDLFELPEDVFDREDRKERGRKPLSQSSNDFFPGQHTSNESDVLSQVTGDRTQEQKYAQSILKQMMDNNS